MVRSLLVRASSLQYWYVLRTVLGYLRN